MQDIPKHIIISRTDSIGDVVLSLPLAGILKMTFPEVKVSFLVSSYTISVVECCEAVDEIIDWTALQKKPEKAQISFLQGLHASHFIHVFPVAELARLVKKTTIKTRIGTARRLYNLKTCNVLLNFSRKNSALHEAQLNTKLLTPFGIKEKFSLTELSGYCRLKPQIPLPKEYHSLINSSKFNLIVHPKSKGSAVDWSLQHYKEVVNNLPEDRFEIFITGTEAEGKLIGDVLDGKSNVHNLTGQLNLGELVSLIHSANGLLACSTGPLHISAALGKHAIGLYSPRTPIHPGRWQPIGAKIKVFCKEASVANSKINDSEMIANISSEEVCSYLEGLTSSMFLPNSSTQ